MKKREEFINEAYNLGFKAGKAFSFLSGIIVGVAITLALTNIF